MRSFVEPNEIGSRTEHCLSRIREFDGALHSFLVHEARQALEEQKSSDSRDEELPLRGLLLGVKDIIDVAGYATGCGSPIHARSVASHDASCVAQLRHAGATMVGKTVTTEFAFFSPGKTRNPHDGSRTPGGSSSGSAAAVAAGFIDVGLGSQTAASITRPASYCGVVGFKPSFGTYSLAGVKGLSPSFDTLGALSRDVSTMAAVHAVLSSSSAEDGVVSSAVVPRSIAICRTPWWDKAEAGTREAISQAERLLGVEAEIVDADMDDYADGVQLHIAIMAFEARQSLANEYLNHANLLSPVLRKMLDDGGTITLSEHRRNLARADDLRKRVNDLTAKFDLLIAPAATGEAPVGLTATGDPTFSRLWTLLRLPTITLPGLKGTNGLPVGVQLLSAVGTDERLLSHALWAEGLLPSRPEPNLALLQQVA